jgi:hypothetical protein
MFIAVKIAKFHGAAISAKAKFCGFIAVTKPNLAMILR